MSYLASEKSVKHIDPLGTLKYHHDELGKLKNTVESLPNYSDQLGELKQSIISLQVSSLDTCTDQKKVLTDLVTELELLKKDLRELKSVFSSTSDTVTTLSQSVNDLKADVPVNESLETND
jgi:chromosome segregation ATPase